MESTVSTGYSSRSNSYDSETEHNKPLLPYVLTSEKPAKKFWFHPRRSLYRKAAVWGLITLILIGIVVFHSRASSIYSTATADSASTLLEPTPEAPVQPDEAEGHGSTDSQAGGVDQTVEDDRKETVDVDNELLAKMPWLRFKVLKGYFNGIKTLVNKKFHVPEYPGRAGAAASSPQVSTKQFDPRPYKEPYKSLDKTVKPCYLDKKKKIPVPNIYAYDGIPQHMPDPVIGSYDLLGLREDVCFDRFGRYGPYGLGYSEAEGGLAIGMDTEFAGNDIVWSKTRKIDYREVDWADAQERCYEDNKRRFRQVDEERGELEPLVKDSKGRYKKGRTAIVIRTYTGFDWTDFAIVNFRAMISELSLKSGGEYDIHFLLHVRENTTPVWSDDEVAQEVLEDSMPAEFHGLVTMWSEQQMTMYYPGNFEESPSNPSHENLRGVFRSGHFALQVFALEHPEYEHFWNWEMDMRYIGNFYELLESVDKWSQKQPRKGIWERNERYYIPSLHESWENFTQTVEENVDASPVLPIFGPETYAGHKTLRYEEDGMTAMPLNCEGQDHEKADPMCGVGEPADLITFNPIFDTDQSGWAFGLDASGYGSIFPRRAAIITASRVSQRLLMAMHEEVWRHRRTMFPEMFPASVALHHGFKAVYAPHPVYLDRAWERPSDIDKAFNSGRDHSTSGPGSPFDFNNEHNHRGASWYFNSEFSGILWRRWLGYAQREGRVEFAGHGPSRGGAGDEASTSGTGRMCMRSTLFHPVKYEHPAGVEY